uniref:hypothetical protein n=1 Tax=Myxococcus guangdongensis TaxID=2906760 RepID=UPI0038990C7E
MELVHDADLATREQARSALFEYIGVFCNHSSRGYVSPVECERLASPGAQATSPRCPRSRGKLTTATAGAASTTPLGPTARGPARPTPHAPDCWP